MWKKCWSRRFTAWSRKCGEVRSFYRSVRPSAWPFFQPNEHPMTAKMPPCIKKKPERLESHSVLVGLGVLGGLVGGVLVPLLWFGPNCLPHSGDKWLLLSGIG